MVEPAGDFLGVALGSIFHPILPSALAFPAGATLFVVSDEVIPEPWKRL